ncbi:MAG: phosphatidylglycerophosphatase A [Rhodospirillales bacterium]|nr:phosphatidylglycerophosphatase A [Rhodospirillales bacterium]
MFWTILATWFGSGLLPKGPGTWGSLAALPFGWLLIVYTGSTGLLVATVAIFFIGWLASNKYMEQASTKHDPGEIVIDEVAGQWLSLFPVSYFLGQADIIGVIAAFILFRIFDILKPWPIRLLDSKVGGGFGVMVDDIGAGIVAAIILWFGYLYIL